MSNYRPRLEPRILLEEVDKNYTASIPISEDDQFENMLIKGDNLLALKALATDEKVKGQVKCIFIDPPYNMGNAFEHYDDGMEHSLWLSMMRERLELLRELLSEDGSMWISIDDNEAHYLKVLCDEIFGRKNFVSDVICEKSDSPRMDAKTFSSRHDHVLVFARNIDRLYIDRMQADIQEHYNRVDQESRRCYTKPLRATGGQGGKRASRPTLYFGLTAPDRSIVYSKKQDDMDGA